MLTSEENERLTRVGPGTPMGELFRRYWHPIAAVSQMRRRSTFPVRILGEDLVLYRDRSGSYGLVGPQCPHRKMSMMYGIPEAGGIRCAYHGWMFDSEGRCVEQPYEDTEDPAGHFREKVKIVAYPVREMSGLVFAYLGPKPEPLLPRWDLYAMEGVLRDIGYAVIPCNWLQIMENSLDPVHVEWLHQNFYNHVVEQLQKPQLRRARQKHAKIGFDRFEYGIIKRRMLEGETEEDDDWKVGHPVVFPNILRQGAVGRKGGAGFQIRVPIDDTRTAHWWYRCYQKSADEPEQSPEEIPFYEVPVPQLSDNGEPQWQYLDNNSGQDIAAWITQGAIVDRSTEALGRSDRGIILYRRMLEEQVALMESGKDPINVFRDPAKNVYLHLPTEENFLAGAAYASNRRTGATTKYSPVLNRREAAGK
ncbi:MAG TPA: aromatic ring-hydroxylating dioxygenase subunit alpha [Candidatus Acidoferrales bacterium]|nr:aromatic ring-hydroxylating dioxygenase subunit alpha [Candidatus Acidoferrales bacterium]